MIDRPDYIFHKQNRGKNNLPLKEIVAGLLSEVCSFLSWTHFFIRRKNRTDLSPQSGTKARFSDVMTLPRDVTDVNSKTMFCTMPTAAIPPFSY